MKTGIYKITNKINGKCYIGQSVFIERRWKDERNGAFDQNDNEYDCARSKAFRKYGIENFDFNIIEECSTEQLNEREAYWIQYYNSYYNGYNETLGGDSATSTKMKTEDLFVIIKLLQENKISEQDIANQIGYSIGTISEINQGHIWKIDELTYPLRTRVNQAKSHVCPYCGKPIDKQSSICVDCLKNKTFNFNTPSKEELMSLLKEHNGNMSAIGRLYNLSKNPIKRLIQDYELEDFVKTLKNKPSPSSRKVIDDEGHVFNSAAEANVYYKSSHVKEVCDGKRKTTAGHSFKWLE